MLVSVAQDGVELHFTQLQQPDLGSGVACGIGIGARQGGA
jgi:hypothetical protein